MHRHTSHRHNGTVEASSFTFVIAPFVVGGGGGGGSSGFIGWNRNRVREGIRETASERGIKGSVGGPMCES